MSYYDFDPSLDFDAQEQQMLQAAARIKALREMKPEKVTNEEIGGFDSALTPGFKYSGKIQKQGILGAAIPLLAGYTADRMGDEVVQNRSRMDQQQQQALKDWIANTPKGTPAVAAQPGIAPLTPNDDEGNAMPIPQAPVAAQAAVAPTHQQILDHAAAGFKAGPLVKATAQAYLNDQLIKEPEREEARAARKAEKEATLAESIRKQKEELRYRRERDEQQAELRRDLAQQAADSRAALHAIAASNKAASSGEKASDYQIVTDKDTGEVYRVGKKPGSKMEKVEGASSGAGAARQKDIIESRGELERAHTAIAAAPDIDKLLDRASASSIKSRIRGAASEFGYSDDATKAEAELKVAADPYLKAVPRFSGPTSDGDRKDYEKAAGQLSNPRIPPEDRKAALRTMVKLQQKSIAQAEARTGSKGSAGGGKWTIEPAD